MRRRSSVPNLAAEPTINRRGQINRAVQSDLRLAASVSVVRVGEARVRAAKGAWDLVEWAEAALAGRGSGLLPSRLSSSCEEETQVRWRKFQSRRKPAISPEP